MATDEEKAIMARDATNLLKDTHNLPWDGIVLCLVHEGSAVLGIHSERDKPENIVQALIHARAGITDMMLRMGIDVDERPSNVRVVMGGMDVTHALPHPDDPDPTKLS